MSKEETERLKKKLTQRRKPVKPDWNKGLSSGSTLLNLATTGRNFATVLPGDLLWVIGDSNSGKSWMTLSCMAEAANNKHYDDYRLIYDSVENGAKMDKGRFFGRKMEERLEAPRYDGELPLYSSTVEEFYCNIDDALESGTPVVYALDSMDALDSEQDEDKFEEVKEAFLKGKKAESGSYGTAKAKANSSGLRRVANKLEKTKSILIIISQTRENIGFGSQFNPKTVSGGKALKFYSHVQLWMSTVGDIKATRKGKTRSLGVNVAVKVDKNRYSGQKHKIEFPIRWNYGLDDLSSMIDWLVEEGVWKKTKGMIEAKGLDLKGTVDGLVAQIEEKKLQRELKGLVTEAWEDIIESCNTGREKRYD